MKGKNYLGKFASQVEVKFGFSEISECLLSYEGDTPDSGIDIHRGYYPGGGYDNIELYITDGEIAGIKVVDPSTGRVYLELGKTEKIIEEV